MATENPPSFWNHCSGVTRYQHRMNPIITHTSQISPNKQLQRRRLTIKPVVDAFTTTVLYKSILTSTSSAGSDESRVLLTYWSTQILAGFNSYAFLHMIPCSSIHLFLIVSSFSILEISAWPEMMSALDYLSADALCAAAGKLKSSSGE